MNIVVGISVVDDDAIIINAIKNELGNEHNYQLEYYQDGHDFLNQMGKHIDIAVIDYMLPGCDGLQILKTINEINPGCYTIILSGQSSKDVVVEMLNQGAYKYVDKERPNWPGQLKQFTHQAYHRVMEKRELIHSLINELPLPDERPTIT